MEITKSKKKTLNGELTDYYEILRQYFPAKIIGHEEDEIKGTHNRKKTTRRTLKEYLGYIEVQLNLRYLSIPEKTLKDIGTRIGVRLDKTLVKDYKKKILKAEPKLSKLLDQQKIAQEKRKTVQKCLEKINKELQTTDIPREEEFMIKQKCLKITKFTQDQNTTSFESNPNDIKKN